MFTFLTVGGPQDLRFGQNFELRDQRVKPEAFTSRWNRFENTFRRAIKITRLIIKRGFSFRWLRLVSCGFRDGDRVKPGVAKVECQGGKVGVRPIRDKRGKIIADR